GTAAPPALDGVNDTGAVCICAAGTPPCKSPATPRPGITGAGGAGAAGPAGPGGGFEIGNAMTDVPGPNVGDSIATVDSTPSSSSLSLGSSSSERSTAIRFLAEVAYRKPSRLRRFRALCRETSTRLPVERHAT